MRDHRHEYVTVFFNRLLPFFTIFFLPIYFKNIGLSGWQIGILLATTPLVSFLVSFPIGMLNDNVASKTLVFLSMIIVSFYYFGLALLTKFWFLVLIFILSGISANLFGVSLNSIVLKTIGRIGKGKILGTYVFFDSLGIGLGLLIGGFLLYIFHFKTVFWITGLSFLALSSYSLLLPKTKTALTKVRDYARDLKNKKVLWLALLYFLLTYHWGPEKTSVMLFLRENVGLNLIQSGGLMGISLFFLCFSAYYFGKKYDKNFHLKKIVIFGLVSSAIGSIGWYFTTNTILILILRMIHEAGDGAFTVFVFLEITDIFKKKRIGGNSALITTVGVLGMVTGTVISGGLGDMFGNAFPILIAGLITLSCLLIVPKLDFSHHETKTQKTL